MGFRFRRIMPLFKGVKLNLSKSGGSLSFGKRGATINLGPKGTRATVGLPGSGASYSAYTPHAKTGRGNSLTVFVIVVIAVVAVLYFTQG